MSPDSEFVTGIRSRLSDLVHRYAMLADDRRLDELAALFGPDAKLSVPEPPRTLAPSRTLSGNAEIRQFLESLEQVDLTFHQIAGEVFDLTDDDRATGRVHCVAHHVQEDQNVVWYLQYSDTYVHMSDGWRYAARSLQIDFIQTMRVSRQRTATG